MHQFVEHMLQHYGYVGLYTALALEYLFIPVPGETTLTTSGILWHPDHLSLFWLLTSTTLGTFTGSMFGYVVGRTLGRPFLERFGRYIRLTPERIDKADRLFAKYTLPTLLISRYIAGIRIITPYLAGINQVPLLLYTITMLFSSLAWTTTFILAGSMIEREWHTVLAHWKQDLIPAIGVIIVLVIGYTYLHRWIRYKVEGAADGTAGRQDNRR